MGCPNNPDCGKDTIANNTNRLRKRSCMAVRNYFSLIVARQKNFYSAKGKLGSKKDLNLSVPVADVRNNYSIEFEASDAVMVIRAIPADPEAKKLIMIIYLYKPSSKMPKPVVREKLGIANYSTSLAMNIKQVVQVKHINLSPNLFNQQCI